MAAQTRTTLKTYFNTGDTPTETQFANLIDSFHNTTDDGTALTDVTGEAIGSLSDVVVTGTPADNEVLAYDSGGNWINQTAAEAGLAAATHTHVEADITDLGTYLTDITGESVGDLSDVTITTGAQGDILYNNGSAWVNLAPGTSGQYLQTQGAAANPQWATLSGGGDMAAATYDPAAISEQLAGLTATQTLTNKTIDADNNTISNIALGAEATGAINDLSDVTITTPADNEVLAYDGVSDFINQTPAEAGLQEVLSEGAFVDGDKTKLDGIETAADVTDATNVAAAGALMSGTATLDSLSAVDTDKSKTPADGDVLTFDGTDWNAEAPAAGGGGEKYWDAIVASSGGDYTTVYDACNAGHKRIFVKDNTTENGNPVLTNGMHIAGDGDCTIDLGTTYYFTATSTLVGCKFENFNFTGTAGQLWYVQGGFDGAVFNNLYGDGGATAARNYWFYGNGAVAQKWRMQFNNCHFYAGSAGDRGCLFVCNGSVSQAFNEVQWNGGKYNVPSANTSLFSSPNVNVFVQFNNAEFYFKGSSAWVGDATSVNRTHLEFNNCDINFQSSTRAISFAGAYANVQINNSNVLWVGSLTDDNNGGTGRIHMDNCFITTSSGSIFYDVNDMNVKVKLTNCYWNDDTMTYISGSGSGVGTSRLECWGCYGDSGNDNLIFMRDTEDTQARNVSGGALTAGDAVIYANGVDLKNQREGVTTTTSAGDKLFYGIVCADASSNTPVYIRRKGYVHYAKVDGTTDIAFGDTLGTHTVAGVLAKNTTAGERVGYALGAYTTDDSNGTIPVFLWGHLK